MKGRQPLVRRISGLLSLCAVGPWCCTLRFPSSDSGRPAVLPEIILGELVCLILIAAHQGVRGCAQVGCALEVLGGARDRQEEGVKEAAAGVQRRETAEHAVPVPAIAWLTALTLGWGPPSPHPGRPASSSSP